MLGKSLVPIRAMIFPCWDLLSQRVWPSKMCMLELEWRFFHKMVQFGFTLLLKELHKRYRKHQMNLALDGSNFRQAGPNMKKIVCFQTRERGSSIFTACSCNWCEISAKENKQYLNIKSYQLTYFAKPDSCAPPDRPSATSGHSALESVSREEGRRVDVAVVAPPVPHWLIQVVVACWPCWFPQGIVTRKPTQLIIGQCKGMDSFPKQKKQKLMCSCKRKLWKHRRNPGSMKFIKA